MIIPTWKCDTVLWYERTKQWASCLGIWIAQCKGIFIMQQMKQYYKNAEAIHVLYTSPKMHKGLSLSGRSKPKALRYIQVRKDIGHFICKHLANEPKIQLMCAINTDYKKKTIGTWSPLQLAQTFPWRVSLSKIEKVPRGIQGDKSRKDTASSGKLVSTIGALASPKKRDGIWCPEG